jgi:SepF-like predicted cell division protein (DUF552 family)
MIRTLLCALLSLGFFVANSSAADTVPGPAVKAQMVKGTIKSANAETGVLIVNQKLKNQVVDRELSIADTTPFSISVDGDTQERFGKEALQFLADKQGASVAVKCDKDVNVVSISVKLKKKK